MRRAAASRTAAAALSQSARETSRCVTMRMRVPPTPFASTPLSFNRALSSVVVSPVSAMSKMTMFVSTSAGSIAIPGISARRFANSRAFA